MDCYNERILINNTKSCINANTNLYNYLKSKYPRMLISLKFYTGYLTLNKALNSNYNYLELIYNNKTYHISFNAYTHLDINKGIYFSISEFMAEPENDLIKNIPLSDLGNNQKFTTLIFRFIKPYEENAKYEQITLF